ncbi:CbtA family protein [Breoghania sp. L-A4]|uniref:CbtA family protein n=1 Tax=Breoghania sp. L-A4 TaxID=2304600 RepID=UPI000E360384|nr:CbtA family protein [Breoghania sp. L-A4]AXS40914.1 cobalt transporter [Breoghania sp. L-A4]
MFARLVWPALGAGCAAGLVLAVLQVFLTTPIILHAEVYETAGLQTPSLMPATYIVDEPALVLFIHGESHEGAEWAPAGGLERTLYSSLAAVLTGVGFALLLVAAMALKGGPVTARSGLAWGAAGFVAFALAPALGLPPELPGSAAAELVSRQIWWTGTVIATAMGLAAMLLSGSRLWLAAGIALIALPHILGAPHPGGYASTAPAELAGHFAAASLATSAVFWAVLGSLAGLLMQRMDGQRQPV